MVTIEAVGATHHPHHQQPVKMKTPPHYQLSSTSTSPASKTQTNTAVTTTSIVVCIVLVALIAIAEEENGAKKENREDDQNWRKRIYSDRPLYNIVTDKNWSLWLTKIIAKLSVDWNMLFNNVDLIVSWTFAFMIYTLINRCPLLNKCMFVQLIVTEEKKC